MGGIHFPHRSLTTEKAPTHSHGWALSQNGAVRRGSAHLGRPARSANLTIRGVDFTLAVSGEEAIADTVTSRRIVAAMRNGESATLVGTSDRGGRFRHHYLLTGAPSAIDAAAVASLR